jgi:hypothetical protein
MKGMMEVWRDLNSAGLNLILHSPDGSAEAVGKRENAPSASMEVPEVV